MDQIKQVVDQTKQVLAGMTGLSSDTRPEKQSAGLADFVKEMGTAPTELDTAPHDQVGTTAYLTVPQAGGSKAGLADKVEGLAQDAKQAVGPTSHEIRVPSHEAFRAPSDAAAVAGEVTSQAAGAARKGFEARTYQMAEGAETPDGKVAALHLHDPKGQEFEGAALSGRTEPFAHPPHGAGASTAQEDRPVKLTMGHDYRHETAEQQQVEGGAASCATAGGAAAGTAAAGADSSRLSMEQGGQLSPQSEMAQPKSETPGAVAAAAGQGGAEVSHMSMEAGGQVEAFEKTDQAEAGIGAVPEVLRDVVGNAAGQPGSGDAAAGMAPHKKDFEAETSAEAKGAESPDGPMEGLHLHAAQGREGAGSRADQQLGQVLKQGVRPPPHGATATTSVQDPPDKMMPHRRDESGVAGRAGATDTTNLTGAPEGDELSAKGGSSALSGMVPHKQDFESELASEAKGAESPDGPMEGLHLHAAQGREGAGSRADQQLGQVLKQGVPTPPHGAGATTSEQDPPDKMMWHHKEEAGAHPTAAAPAAAGGGGSAASSTPAGPPPTSGGAAPPSGAGAPTSEQDPSNKMMPHRREEAGIHPAVSGGSAGVAVDDGRVLKSEGIGKLAEAMAEVTEKPVEQTLLSEPQKVQEQQKNEKLLRAGHEQPYVEEEEERAGAAAGGAAASGYGPYARASDAEMQGQAPTGGA